MESTQVLAAPCHAPRRAAAAIAARMQNGNTHRRPALLFVNTVTFSAGWVEHGRLEIGALRKAGINGTDGKS